MTFFWIILYNTMFVPIAFVLIQIISLFDEKVRRGLSGRRMSWVNLRKFREKYPNKELFLIHSASLGEFEQAKPVIRGLKALRPDVLIVASFTSPSGYENAVRIPEVDLFIYLPIDTFLRVRRFIQKLKPQKIIFVTYELWPNLIVNAKRHHVPTYLMSARIRRDSSKWMPIVRNLFRTLYRMLDYIYAISEEDRLSVKNLTGSVNIKVLTLGDTRYDQVIQRAHERMHLTIPKLFDEGFVFIGGSIWPQDARHLLPALFKSMEQFESLKVIMAPHEPNEYALEMLEDSFQQEGFSTLRLSKFKSPVTDLRVILVDKVGILAELYYQANLAFIGGSFRGSIHNVMEPAVAGLPVLFGPTYHNSREAEILIRENGGWCCEDGNCFYDKIKSLIRNPELYKKASFSARQVIMKNLGASARTVKEILELD